MVTDNDNSKNNTFKNVNIMGAKNLKTLKWTLIAAWLLNVIILSNANAANFYWVGGTGNWGDVSHWATTSGGTTFYTQPPASTDDVFFDNNSFQSNTDTVYSSVSQMFCKNFDATAINKSATFSLRQSLNVDGSFKLSSIVKFDGNNAINLSSNGNIEFNAAGVDLDSTNVNFNSGSGNRFVAGNIITKGLVNITAGDFYFENINLTAQEFYSTTTGSLNLGTSVFNIAGFYTANNAVADSAYVYCVGFFGDGGTYKYVQASLVAGTASFQSVYASNYDVNYIYANEAHVTSSINNYFVNDVSSISHVVKLIFDDADSTYFSTAKLIVDTLFFNNPGGFVGIRTTDTLFITSQLIANSNAGDYITLRDTFTVAGAILSKSSGNVCLDYMQLKGIVANGTSTFNAGASSINAGGNTNWLFSTCTNVSDVWPGDANYDLTVNNIDVLNIGVAYNETGPVRTGASLTYTAQPATDWSSFFATAVNKKHADTNGDGVVNDTDTLAIALNYGLTHPARIPGQQSLALPTDPYLYVDVTPDSTNLSDTVYIETYYGTAQTPVDSVYGIAFTINYDTALVDTTWISNQFLPSWLGQPGVDLITFVKSIPLEGKIDFALVRNNHTNATGFGGGLTRTGIVIVDNVAGRIPVPFTLSNLYGITASEYLVGINIGNDFTLLDTTSTGIQNPPAFQQFTIMPNPASQFIVLSNLPPNATAEVYNTTGQIILQQNITEARTLLNIQSLTKGIYTLRINSNNKIFIGKLVKL